MLLLKSLFHLLEFILFFIINKKSIIPKIALIWQENQRYKRYFNEKNIKLSFSIQEKWFIRSIFISNPKARKYFTLVTPETVLYSWKNAIKDYWTYDKPNYSWSRFLKAHWQSLYACDFFTVDIFGFKRFYVFFIIELKSRKIVHYNVTKNPNILFLRSQLSHFEELYPDSYLIHDNSGELKYFPYHEYEINGVATTSYSPNLNAYAERFIRSVRQECLDCFFIFSEKQLRNILKSYMNYYNNFRPHQGINSIPKDRLPDVTGKIKKKTILYGLHHHYYRAS